MGLTNEHVGPKILENIKKIKTDELGINGPN